MRTCTRNVKLSAHNLGMFGTHRRKQITIVCRVTGDSSRVSQFQSCVFGVRVGFSVLFFKNFNHIRNIAAASKAATNTPTTWASRQEEPQRAYSGLSYGEVSV